MEAPMNNNNSRKNSQRKSNNRSNNRSKKPIRELFPKDENNKPFRNLNTNNIVTVPANPAPRLDRKLFLNNPDSRDPSVLQYNIDNNDNRMNANNKKYTYIPKKYTILNYQDPKYQNTNLAIDGILNQGFTLTPDIEAVLTGLSDIIQKTVNEKAGSNCTIDQFKKLLQKSICNKNMTLLKDSKCADGAFKIVLKCDRCDFVYMFDFKKLIINPGDDIFMKGGVVDLSDLDNIMLAGPSYFRPILINTTTTTTPNIRFDFMIARNYGLDLFDYYYSVNYWQYFDHYGVPLNDKSYLLSICILLTLLYTVSLLHDRNMFHCDIKIENILMGNDSTNPITLTDFGFFINDNEDLFPKQNYMPRGTDILLTKKIIGAVKGVNKLSLLDYKDLDLHSLGFTSLIVLTGKNMKNTIKELNPNMSILNQLYHNGNDIINDMFQSAKQGASGTKLQIINIMEKLSKFGFSVINIDEINHAQNIYDELLEIIRGDPDLNQQIKLFLQQQQLRLNPEIIF